MHYARRLAGRITPSEGAALATIVKSYTDAIEIADVVKRVEASRGTYGVRNDEEYPVSANRPFAEISAALFKAET